MLTVMVPVPPDEGLVALTGLMASVPPLCVTNALAGVPPAGVMVTFAVRFAAEGFPEAES